MIRAEILCFSLLSQLEIYSIIINSGAGGCAFCTPPLTGYRVQVRICDLFNWRRQAGGGELNASTCHPGPNLTGAIHLQKWRMRGFWRRFRRRRRARYGDDDLPPAGIRYFY